MLYLISQMPLSIPYWNNMFAQNMHFHVNQVVHDNSAMMNGFKGSTQLTKDELQVPKSNEDKPKKPKKKANKIDAQETWVPKST